MFTVDIENQSGISVVADSWEKVREYGREGYRPYDFVYHVVGRNLYELLELISFPFVDDERGEIVILAREFDNPMTMKEIRVVDCHLKNSEG